MKWLLLAAVIAFIVILVFLLRSINNIKKIPIVFKDRSVVNAACIGKDAQKYADILNDNDLKCAVVADVSDGSFTHCLFVDNDETNMENISIANCCERYAICNDERNTENYVALGVKFIDTKKPEEVVYQIIAGLKDNDKKED